MDQVDCTVRFCSSIGTNGTIGTNGVTWHSIGTLLVKCISLRALRGTRLLKLLK